MYANRAHNDMHFQTVLRRNKRYKCVVGCNLCKQSENATLCVLPDEHFGMEII